MYIFNFGSVPDGRTTNEALSDRLKARLASMSSKGGDEEFEEDDEPLDEELSISDMMKARIQYMIDHDLSYMPTEDERRKIYQEYEAKKNASKKSPPSISAETKASISA